MFDFFNLRKKRRFREWIRRLRMVAPIRDNRGIGAVEMVVIAVIIGCLVMLLFPQLAKADTGQDMYLTCYTPVETPGTITYTGAKVREGIAATHPEHIGDMAMIYTMEGVYLGTWQDLDKLGTGKRSVIDVWKPDLDSAKELMALTRGRVKVYWIKGAAMR